MRGVSVCRAGSADTSVTGPELPGTTPFSPQIYELRVMETKPDRAVSIIECDMNVSGCGIGGERAADAARTSKEAADL